MLSRYMKMNKKPIAGIFLAIAVILLFEVQILDLTTKVQVLTDKAKKEENLRLEKRNEEPEPSTKVSLNSQEDDLPVVIYNRVPKTGSTTFTRLVYELAKPNQIYVSHINMTKNSFRMSVADQFSFVWNVTSWQDHKPAFYHGHIGHIPFARFGAGEPVYINILREPLERLVSYYYFLRYGDDYRKGLQRAKQHDKTSFDECVKKQGNDCHPKQLWVQIPFLCGHSAECWRTGSSWALSQAKKNLLTKYLLVGVTEDLESFSLILEATLPRVFKGLTAKYREGDRSHVRKTLHKEPLADETVATIRASKPYKMERELYDFALAHFIAVKQLATQPGRDGQLRPAPRKWRYEKVYGPRGKIMR